MSEFKIGDKVKRVKDEWMGMKVGDVAIIQYQKIAMCMVMDG